MDTILDGALANCASDMLLGERLGHRPLPRDDSASVEEVSPARVDAVSRRANRIKPSQRQLEAAALEEALSLLGFNPRLLCHFLWGKKAPSLRLALSFAEVGLDSERASQALNTASACLKACRLDGRRPGTQELRHGGPEGT